MHSPVIPPFEYTGYKKVITPPTIKQNQEALKMFNHAVEKNIEFNDLLVDNKIPDEHMVYSRIAGNTLNVVSGMNGRELYHFFALRTCERAQWEIREYAEELLKMVKQKAPLLFKNAGPGCVRYGYCPEGKMTCGKIKEKLEYFNSL
jgi:thymidylate synthase (FAD)